MGQLVTCTDQWPTWPPRFFDPFDPWPMTHWPIVSSGLMWSNWGGFWLCINDKVRSLQARSWRIWSSSSKRKISEKLNAPSLKRSCRKWNENTQNTSTKWRGSTSFTWTRNNQDSLSNLPWRSKLLVLFACIRLVLAWVPFWSTWTWLQLRLC